MCIRPTRSRRCASSLPSDLVQAFSVIAGSHLQEDAPLAIVCGGDCSGPWTTSQRFRRRVRLGPFGPPNACRRSIRSGPGGCAWRRVELNGWKASASLGTASLRWRPRVFRPPGHERLPVEQAVCRHGPTVPRGDSPEFECIRIRFDYGYLGACISGSLVGVNCCYFTVGYVVSPRSNSSLRKEPVRNPGWHCPCPATVRRTRGASGCATPHHLDGDGAFGAPGHGAATSRGRSPSRPERRRCRNGRPGCARLERRSGNV